MWEIFSFGKCKVLTAILLPHSTVLLYIAYKHYFLHVGDQPYSELVNTVLLSSIMAGYRLKSPKG